MQMSSCYCYYHSLHFSGQSIQRVKVSIEQSVSGIDAALTRRYDMLTKLVDTTKQYMTYEKETLIKVVELRSKLGSMSIQDKGAFESEMSKVSSGLNVTVENYPELRSNVNVVELQKAVVDTKDDLYAARRFYNSNVGIYNEMIRVFPSSIIANSRKHSKEDFFEAETHKREDVKVNII